MSRNEKRKNDMANIREGADRAVRPNVRPWAVGLGGFLTVATLMVFYWEAEAADRASGNLWPKQASTSFALSVGPVAPPPT